MGWEWGKLNLQEKKDKAWFKLVINCIMVNVTVVWQYYD